MCTGEKLSILARKFKFTEDKKEFWFFLLLADLPFYWLIHKGNDKKFLVKGSPSLLEEFMAGFLAERLKKMKSFSLQLIIEVRVTFFLHSTLQVVSVWSFCLTPWSLRMLWKGTRPFSNVTTISKAITSTASSGTSTKRSFTDTFLQTTPKSPFLTIIKVSELT